MCHLFDWLRVRLHLKRSPLGLAVRQHNRYCHATFPTVPSEYNHKQRENVGMLECFDVCCRLIAYAYGL